MRDTLAFWVLLAVVVVVAIRADDSSIPDDHAGKLKFRHTWSSPPECIVTTTETSLMYYCISR